MSLTISLPNTRNDYLKWAGIFVAASSGAVFCRFVYKVATDPIQVIWDLVCDHVVLLFLIETRKHQMIQHSLCASGWNRDCFPSVSG